MFSNSAFIRFIIYINICFQNSLIYKYSLKILDFIDSCFIHSCLFKIIGTAKNNDSYTRSSVFYSFLNKIINIILGFLRSIYIFISRINEGSLNSKLYHNVIKNSKCIHFEIIAAFSIAIMYIVPHHAWNNMYAILITLSIFILYLVIIMTKPMFQINIFDISPAFIIFIIASVFGVLFSSAKADSIRIFSFFATSFLLFLIVYALTNNIKRLNMLAGYLYLGLLITSIYAIYQGIIGVAVDATLTDITTNSGMPGRVYSTFGNPNNYAEFILLVMPFGAAFSLNQKNKFLKTVSLLCLILPLTALLSTYARSSWLGFMLAAFVFIILYNYKLLPYFIPMILAAIPFMPKTIYARILTIGSMSDSSNSYRIYIWEGVLKVLKEFPITGIGIGPKTFSMIYPRFANSLANLAPHSHMLYLEVWLETGIIGLISFLTMLFSALKNAYSYIFKNIDKQVKNMLIASVASLLGIMVMSFAEYVWFYPRVMFIFFVCFGMTFSSIRLAKEKNNI